ncbi:MAG: hypothetical protein RLZZ274_165 [Cyanobacteriota bacterium]
MDPEGLDRSSHSPLIRLAGIPPVIDWRTCPPAPLAWIPLRELLLGLVHTPALLLPLTAALGLALAWWLQLSRSGTAALSVLLPLALSAFYSPLATALLSGWLQSQLPAAPSFAPASTEAAAQRLRQGQAVAAYVSGDARSTAERLVQLGIAPSRIAGDSCARTTWENATLTAAWLGQHHPGAPVLLITDPWQLPRASHAFSRQGLQVQPLAAEPPLSAPERSRLVLRETAATLLYQLQGRM